MKKDTVKPTVIKLKELINKKYPAQKSIVEGLINHSELILLSATAKTGKSLFACDLALAVSNGDMFLGKFNTFKGKVLVIQTEISERMLSERMRKVLESDFVNKIDLDVCFCDYRFRLDGNGLNELHSLVKEQKPSLLILDPFYTLHGKNEDVSGDIAPILTNLKRLIISCDVGCILIHHQGKRSEGSGSRQVGHKHRGSSAFADVPDSSWSLERTKEKDVFTLSFEMRNHQPIDPITLRRDCNLKWEALKTEVNLVDHFTTEDIFKLFKEEQEISSSELRMQVMDLSGLKDRAAISLINKAVKFGRLVKRREGKNVFYKRQVQ